MCIYIFLKCDLDFLRGTTFVPSITSGKFLTVEDYLSRIGCELSSVHFFIYIFRDESVF